MAGFPRVRSAPGGEQAATSAPSPWKAASSSMDSSSHLPVFCEALLWRRRYFVRAALKGCMSEQKVKRAHKVLSRLKQTACVGASIRLCSSHTASSLDAQLDPHLCRFPKWPEPPRMPDTWCLRSGPAFLASHSQPARHKDP